MKLTPKEKIACVVTGTAGLFWGIDALTKYWALHNLVGKPMLVIPNFLYLILGTNPGGSLGISREYMELCLTLPATLVFILVLWIGRRLRAGKPITLFQQIGFGIFIGGALANWSERVLHNGVTDFIFLKPFDFCIFNLADVFIDFGYLIIVLETLRLAMAHRSAKRQLQTVDTPGT
jgi:signal peptidase II